MSEFNKLFNKLVKLREKNWSIQDYIEYHDDVVYHSYNIESLKESIKDEEEEWKKIYTNMIIQEICWNL